MKKEIKIDNKQFKVWISLIKNLGFKRYERLVQNFNSQEELWYASNKQLSKIEGIGEKISEMLSNKKIKEDVKRHIEYMERYDIDIIGIEDEEYPWLLKKIPNPPLCIYIIGRKEILNETNIAIVGSRDATEYGKYVAKSFSSYLSMSGLNIVSGLARGIDSYAHIGALRSKGKTIAVLGNGLDTIFPKENKKMAKEIIDTGGCIISEYPLGTRTR